MPALCVMPRMAYLDAVKANCNSVADVTVFLATVPRGEGWRDRKYLAFHPWRMHLLHGDSYEQVNAPALR